MHFFFKAVLYVYVFIVETNLEAYTALQYSRFLVLNIPNSFEHTIYSASILFGISVEASCPWSSVNAKLLLGLFSL